MVRVVLPIQTAVETVAGLGGPGQPTIVVRSYGRDGQGYDLTPYVDGLNWSSVNPGGDETCTFRLARQWFSGAPEVRKGNRLEVQSGPDVLWRGRVEENEGTVDQAEMIGVVAYGSGIVLRDSRMREIYCDRRLEEWRGPSLERRIALNATYSMGDASVIADATNEAPALLTAFEGQWSSAPGNPLVEGWYDAGDDLALDSVIYTWRRENVNETDPEWTWSVNLTDDDAFSSANGTGELRALGPGSGTLVATTDTRRFAMVSHGVAESAASGGGAGVKYGIYWTLAVFGRHGVPRQGADPGGFYASQIVANIVGRVSGIRVRRIDQSTYLILHSTFKEPTAHEEAVKETSKYEPVDWGTWGPDSVLERSTDGNFDWKAKQPTTAHWIVQRSECESVRLNTELSSLFNQVDVHYTDHSGASRVVSRTVTVPELDEADPPITRTGRVDGGTLTTAGAEQLGDAFLALSGQHAPARGNVVIAQPIRHHARGHLPPHYMRADGSNLQVPDVLPSREMFALSQDPDRRTLLPIQRVSVDASGPVPKASVEVDQQRDLLSILQARLGQSAQLVG